MRLNGQERRGVFGTTLRIEKLAQIGLPNYSALNHFGNLSICEIRVRRKRLDCCFTAFSRGLIRVKEHAGIDLLIGQT